MDEYNGILGAHWFDVLIEYTALCIVHLPNQTNRVKPARCSEVQGYPTGFVWLKQRGHVRSGLMR